MGELARKPGCPELPASPLELMTPRPGEGYTKVDWILPNVVGAVGGGTIYVLMNLVRKRPAWSGIHMTIFMGGVGWALTSLVQKAKFQSRAERDAVFKHYISLHPEDFPAFERKRFAEVYQPFKPIR